MSPQLGWGRRSPGWPACGGKGHVYILYQPVFIPETSKGPENGCLIGLGSCQMNKSGKQTPSPSSLHPSEPRTRGICGWNSALANREPLHQSGQAWWRSRNEHLLSPSSQRLPTTRLHVHSWSMSTVEWRWLSNTAALGTIMKAPSRRGRGESMAGCELSQNFCSKRYITSSHLEVSLARATHLTTHKFGWAKKCDSTMCPQTRRPNICQQLWNCHCHKFCS